MSAPRRAVPPRRAAQVTRRGPRPLLTVVGLFVLAIAFAGVGGWSLLQALSPSPVTAAPAQGWELTEPPATTASSAAPQAEESTVSPDLAHGDERLNNEAATEPSATSPSPRATETSTNHAVPQGSWLVIDQLKVAAPIDVVGTRSGELLVPGELDRVGLWEGGAQLADGQGTVLVAGHVAIGERRGVGYRWSELTPGAEVHTIDDGVRQRWRAISLDVYDGYELPTELFNRTGPRRLALVTCSGPVVTVDGRREYRDNVVVIAEPIE